MNLQDFYEEHFYPEWHSQGCPRNENGDPILYDPFLEDEKEELTQDEWMEMFINN